MGGRESKENNNHVLRPDRYATTYSNWNSVDQLLFVFAS